MLRSIVEELSSPRFVRFLSTLTGIPGLFLDRSLEGSGLHQSRRGGFLNIHTDFAIHPHHANWRRRVNVLVYFNEGWKDTYGGHLEFWNRGVTRCVQRIAPIFNRCVIFTTHEHSFHGHPRPLACPAAMTRKSLALYYYTEEPGPVEVRATRYRPLPGDGLRRVLIHLDNIALSIYDRARRRLGFHDSAFSRFVRRLPGRKRR